MRVALVVNPTSGRGRGAQAAVLATARLQHRGIDVTVLTGDDAAHAGRLVAEAVAGAQKEAVHHDELPDGATAPDGLHGIDGVVSVGGDGMAHLVLQGIADSGVPLGIVPAGTGNDLAHTLQLPVDDPEKAADVIADALLAGRTRAVDGAVCTSPDGAITWWACVMGAGFDSAVTERANGMRWPRGPRRYDLAILAELRVFKPIPFVITLDGVRQETRAMFVAVGNAKSYGAGMMICPAADVEDGLLDVTVVTPVSLLTLVKIFPRIYKGTHVLHPAVKTYRATEVTLEAPSIAYADGERVGPLPVTTTVKPGLLRLLA